MGPVGKAEGWRDMPDGVAARRSVNGRGGCPDPFSPFRSFEKLRDGRPRCPSSSFLQNPGTAMRATPVSGAERRAEPAEIVGGISRRSASRPPVGRIAVPGFCKSLPIRRRSCRSAFRTFSGHPADRAPAGKLHRHALPPCREYLGRSPFFVRQSGLFRPWFRFAFCNPSRVNMACSGLEGIFRRQYALSGGHLAGRTFILRTCRACHPGLGL